MPDNPAVAFLKLIELQGKNQPRYEKELKHSHQLFPHYPLIHILWTTNEWPDNEMSNPTELFIKGPEEFFAEKKELHFLEMFHYFYMLINMAVISANATLIETLELTLWEVDLGEFDDLLIDVIALGKIHAIVSRNEEIF